VLGLTGCALDNPNNQNGDIEPGDPAAFVAPAVGAPTAGARENVPMAVQESAVIAAQEGVAVLRFQPVSQQLNVGDQGVVQIQIDNVVDLYGFELGVQFNPALIQIQDTDPSQNGVQIQPGAFLAPDLIVTNHADNNMGIITYIVTQTAPNTPVSGNGTIATITFAAVSAGSMPLNFTIIKLADPDTNQIPANAQLGQIIVLESGQPTPTPTSTPDGPTATPQNTPTPTPTLVVVTIEPTFTPTFVPPSPTPLPPPTNTPLPPNMVIPPGATVGFCYRVEACETLACVAQKFGVDAAYLNLVNDLAPPGYVFMNQALFIPTQYGRGPNVYVVAAGDSLFSIADACHLPLDFLAWVNCLPQDANLEPGHVLEIPIPPFPPPSRYAYPGSIAPSVPSDKPFPPPSVGCRGGCTTPACGPN
jgi:LysM repeat protein